MTRKIPTLVVAFVILLSLSGISRAADFIGCIGEYRGPSGCAGALKALRMLPKPDYWRDCNFAKANPIFSDDNAAHDFCASKHMRVEGEVQRFYNGGGDACGYIIDRVKCVPQ
ncbi:hypothetical protein [Bradyrhizobium sp. dw_411]|uniref:hypothetical protein n=1 Tax=Bradyrhizobium sp. dw_411 TaxID=2720082 RepID=UPI001BCF62BA|nr:hypothetical protein [Bradyrhizobium sp. dw_411]